MEKNRTKKLLDSIDRATNDFYLAGVEHAKAAFKKGHSQETDDSFVQDLNDLKFQHTKIIAKNLIELFEGKK